MIEKPFLLKQKMLLQRQMHCGVVVRLVISLCFVGFTAARCVPEKCGDFEVSFPFWINNSDCGFSRYFHITCKEDRDTGTFAPFFKISAGFISFFGKSKYYKIAEIDYTGHLIIDSSNISISSCERNQFFVLLSHSFTLSKSNRLVVFGCDTFGTYSYGDYGEAKCVSICSPSDSQREQPYCRHGCCEINLQDNWPSINFTAGVVHLPIHKSSECAFATIMDPSTFTFVGNKSNRFRGERGKTSYGLRLNWGIGGGNCSDAKAMGNYSCSSNAECIESPTWRGHVCKCLPGYEGNGYSNGTGCKGKTSALLFIK